MMGGMRIHILCGILLGVYHTVGMPLFLRKIKMLTQEEGDGSGKPSDFIKTEHIFPFIKSICFGAVFALIITITVANTAYGSENTVALLTSLEQVHPEPVIIEVNEEGTLPYHYHEDIYGRVTLIREYLPFGFTKVTQYKWYDHMVAKNGVYIPVVQQEVEEIMRDQEIVHNKSIEYDENGDVLSVQKGKSRISTGVVKMLSSFLQ